MLTLLAFQKNTAQMVPGIDQAPSRLHGSLTWQLQLKASCLSRLPAIHIQNSPCTPVSAPVRGTALSGQLQGWVMGRGRVLLYR